MTPAELDALKADARLHMRAVRGQVEAPRAPLDLIDRFPRDLARLSPVAGYWPVGGEIDPRPLLAVLAKGGREIVLPRVDTRTGPTHFYVWRTGEALRADAFGVPSPPPGKEMHPKLILTPLLAFDRSGRRLGQGGGHYDRILARYRAEGAIAVGLAFAEQEMDLVPAGAYDTPLDWVLTPDEAIRCASKADGLKGLSSSQ